MNNSISVPRASRILAATAAVFMTGPSLAQQQQSAISAAPYLVPENSVSIGAGVSSGDEKDRARSGMFNGLRKNDANLLLDFNYGSRDSEAGRWVTIEGRNIGLDNREFGATYRNLGDFKLKVDYSEITRHDPRTINTSLTGSGTTTPTVSLLATPGTGQDLNLELKRKALGFDISKRYGNFELEVNFKNEDKNGARFFGRGLACGAAYVAVGGACTAAGSQTALLMLPEPVDSTIRQLDAKLNYSGEKLKLSGGYYGNFYTNNNGSFAPNILGGTIGNLNGGTVAWDPRLKTYMQTPMALWPDSRSHQLFLGGNYALTSHTRLNFKYSYTHATQNESYTGMGLTPRVGGRDNLGGILNTTKAQLGFSSRPLDKLHVHGDVSYVSKNNKTPVELYNNQGGTWTNSAMSPKKFDAKLEANYRLPYTMLLTGGVKYEREDTGAWTPTDVAGGINALRQKTDSWSTRVELRKTMSETFSGAIALVSERRDGASSWLKPNALPLTGVFNASADCASVGTNACVFSPTAQIPYTQKDMQRQKIRLTGNWEPVERLSLQAFLDTGHDDFRGPTTTSGLFKTTMYNITLDATYALSDNWKISGYVTNSQQSQFMGHAADYDGTVRDTSTTVGLGFSGTPVARFRIGGDLMSLRDKLSYGMSPDAQISVGNQTLLNTTGGLPDVKYNLLRLKLYGEYTVDKASTVRLDYIYNRTFFNEWTYGNNGVPFLYSDNTTLSAKETQSVSFIGASYVYKFQ